MGDRRRGREPRCRRVGQPRSSVESEWRAPDDGARHRAAELRRHLDHLREIRPRVDGPGALDIDLSLHNDVLYSLLTVAQIVIDVAGELSARERHRFEDYTTAVRNLTKLGFPSDVVAELALLPGLRNVLVHEYVGVDYELVLRALDNLGPVDTFLRVALEKTGA